MCEAKARRDHHATCDGPVVLNVSAKVLSVIQRRVRVVVGVQLERHAVVEDQLVVATGAR